MELRWLARKAYAAIPFKRQMFQPLRRLGLPEPIYRHLHFEGPFDTGLGFRLHAGGEVVENELFWGGGWEELSLRTWRDLARSAEGVLDIGANTGVFALAAKAANPMANVTAFEPVKRIADRLRKNIVLNGFEIVVEELAISDRNGFATFHDCESEMPYSASLEAGMAGNTFSYEVKTMTVDRYLGDKGWPKIDLVKIDVEKHEPAVFRGMRETIERFRPTMIVEVLTPEIGRELLLPGYSYSVIHEQRGLIATEVPKPLDGNNWNNLFRPQ